MLMRSHESGEFGLVYLLLAKLLQLSLMFGHLHGCQAANANVGIEQLTNKEQTGAIRDRRGPISCKDSGVGSTSGALRNQSTQTHTYREYMSVLCTCLKDIQENCNILLISGIFPEHFRTGQRGHNGLKLVIWAISLLEIQKNCNFLCSSRWAFEVRVLNAFNCVRSSSLLIQQAVFSLRPFTCGSCDDPPIPLLVFFF